VSGFPGRRKPAAGPAISLASSVAPKAYTVHRRTRSCDNCWYGASSRCPYLAVAARRCSQRLWSSGKKERAEAYAVGEYQIDRLGSPKLIILPSPYVLTAEAWDAIVD
jgi:hypothetical protein